MDRIWILGSPDPEMATIEARLAAAGERVAYATRDGRRVTGAGAYDGPDITLDGALVYGLAAQAVCVECRPWATHGSATSGCAWAGPVAVVDHHRPGDPGHGRGPEAYLAASSLGQVLAILGVSPTPTDRIVAAADHCLAAAYRGACPGVDPGELMRWRAASRAEFQGRDIAAVIRDVEAATAALAAAPVIQIADGVTVRDMRAPVPVPELPEAACRLGVAYVSGPLVGPDGAAKYTVSGPPDTVRAWMAWALAQGLTGIYGDPARGYAGGYAAR